MIFKKGRGLVGPRWRFIEALEERRLLAGVLLKDINTATASSSPNNAVALGSSVLFLADDGVNGKELWSADGAGATRLTNFPSTVTVGSSSGEPALVRMNGFVYFAALDGLSTTIWRSDGTGGNTVAISNNVGGVTSLAAAGDRLFFATRDANGVRLWASSGLTVGSEQLLKQFDAGTIFAMNLTDVSGTLIFSIDNSTGSQLWKSDGTEAGTLKVKDFSINDFLNYSPSQFRVMGGVLYFPNGRAIWRSDGTEAGTYVVKTLTTSGSASISSVVTTGTKLFFSASAGGGQELWQSDGTELGTSRVKDIFPGLLSSEPSSLAVSDGVVYFSANDGTHGTELWRSDGTDAGTFMVLDAVAGTGSSTPTEIRAAGGAIYFQAKTATGVELWKSDGTPQGTAPLKEIYGGLRSSTPAGFVQAGSAVYFSATDNLYGRELWTTDGTAAGTRLVADINQLTVDSAPTKTVEVNGTLFFVANSREYGQELWESDGSAAGTRLVKDIFPGPDDSAPDDLIKVGNTLFFSATDASGRGLWKTDGTAAGTVFVSDQDIALNFGDEAVVLGDSLIYTSFHPTYGYELWKTDGTTAGTVLIKDVNQTASTDRPEHLIVYKGKVYFAENSGNFGRELWRTDGTAAGTVMVTEIYPGTGSAFPSGHVNYNPVIFNGLLYFPAQTAQYGPELWATDGTSGGTFMVYDSNPTRYGYGLLPHDLHVMGNYLYFAGDNDVDGDELWRTTGRSYETVMVKDINPGVGASAPRDLVDLNGVLYFQAYDSVNGNELWRSDGTAAGTWMVKDLRPGNSGSPTSLTVLQNRFWFVASASSTIPSGLLWVSDGTTDGTIPLHAMKTSSTGTIAQLNGAVFFNGYDPAVGDELYKIALPTVRAGGPYQVAAGNNLTLDGSLSSDAGGNPITKFIWDLDGDGIFGETGAAATRGDEIGARPTLSTFDLAPGNWTVWLDVTDGQGVSAFGPVNVSVKIPDLMVLSDDATLSWDTQVDPHIIRLTGGRMTLNGSLKDDYLHIALWLYNDASVRIAADQEFSSLDFDNASVGWLTAGVLVRATGISLTGGGHLDIGSGRIEETVVQSNSMYFMNLAINNGQVYSSAAYADSRLGLALVQSPEKIVVTAALKGDLNLDGTVSITDFIDLASNFGKANATWAMGDTNGDATVSIADFITLASNYGQTFAGEAEPAPPMAAAGEAVALQRIKTRTATTRRHHHRKPLSWNPLLRRWEMRR